MKPVAEDWTTVPDELLKMIRPAIRRASEYRVGTVEGISVKLNQNESPYDFPPELKRQVAEEFLSIPWNRYPAEQPDRLRHAIALAMDYDPEGILVGNGSNEITYTFGLTLVEKETPVVLPRPMFSLYEKVARLYDGRVIGIPPRDDLTFDAEAIVTAVKQHRPALVVLTTPNNPTGRAMKFEEVEAVLDAATGFVLVDEAYVEFSDEPSARPLIAGYPNLIVMRTFSKAMGLAGLRIGFLMGRPEVIREFNKSRIPFVVDRLAETAAMTLLKHRDVVAQHVGEIKRSREMLFRNLRKINGLTVIPSQANFVIFGAEVPPQELVRRLASFDVLVRDVSGYPELAGFVRVNAGLPGENQAFLSALEKSLSMG